MTRHTREKYENDRANREYWNSRPSVVQPLRILSYDDWLEEHEWADDYMSWGPMTMTEWREWKQDVEAEAQRQYYRAYAIMRQEPEPWEDQDDFTKSVYYNSAKMALKRS